MDELSRQPGKQSEKPRIERGCKTGRRAPATRARTRKCQSARRGALRRAIEEKRLHRGIAQAGRAGGPQSAGESARRMARRNAADGSAGTPAGVAAYA